MNTKTIRLVLVLLNLSCDLCHHAPLTEVDKFRRTGKVVWVALLSMKDIGQVHA